VATIPSKSLSEGTAYTLTLKGTDRGTKDRASLQYALDCGQGAGYTAWSATNVLSCAVIADQRPAFPVRAKVRDKDGGETEYQINLTITNAAPVVTLAATSATAIQVGQSVSFQGSFTDKGVNDAPWTYSLAWSDGTAAQAGTLPQQGGVITGTHVFNKAGTFSVRLSVRDKDGTTGRSTIVTVTVAP
jgi:PKD repeat protein